MTEPNPSQNVTVANLVSRLDAQKLFCISTNQWYAWRKMPGFPSPLAMPGEDRWLVEDLSNFVRGLSRQEKPVRVKRGQRKSGFRTAPSRGSGRKKPKE